MFDYWAGAMSRALAPAPGFVQAVTDLLAPRFELPRSLGAAIKGDDRELLRLTEDQFRVLDMLSRQRRVAVSGGAGTGKTMLALEKARRLAGEGLEVVLGHGESGGQPVPGHVRGRPAAGLLRAHPAGGALRRARQAAAALRCHRRRRGAGVLSLYRRSNAFPAGMLEIPLRDNLRNTRRISTLTEHFYQGPPMRALGPEGQDVERIAIQDGSEIERQVSRALHHLIKDNGIAPADIAVLMGSGRACPLRKGQRIGAFETTSDQAAEPSKVLLETVRRFKGLERSVIVLTGIDDLPAADETALRYCGLSRARVHLVIVATGATMERVGGGAGRR